MNQNMSFRIEPVDSAEMLHILDSEFPIPQGTDYFIITWGAVLTGIVGIVFIFINMFTGGYHWLIFSVITVTLILIARKMIKDAKHQYRELKAKEEAEFLSSRLNELLIKSDEIFSKILPYLESMVDKNISIAKIDFNENALSPFWDRIEESTNYLACYKEAVDQLVYNCEIYKKILENKQHNFPTPFPFGINISFPQNTLDEFYALIRKAQTRFEFANIWEHKKTQKILVEGFRTLAEAINNMRDAILDAISDLKHSIKSDLSDLKNIQIEQIKSFETGQKALNNTLTSMDNKLYYMQYNKKPLTPFIRPLLD